MKKTLLTLLILAACMGCPGIAARAADVKFPVDKDPAFAFSLPGGWTSAPDGGGNMVARSASHSAVVMLSMVTDPSALKIVPDEMCRLIFKSANVEDGDKKEPTEFGGQKGMAYYGTSKVPGGVMDLKLILVKPDDVHLAVITVMTLQTISADDLAALEKVLEGFKFTAGK